MVLVAHNGVVEFQRFDRGLAAVRTLLVLKQNPGAIERSYFAGRNTTAEDLSAAVEGENLSVDWDARFVGFFVGRPENS